MAANHHHFVFQLRVGTGNFSDGIETVFVVASELGVDIHFHRDRDVRFQQPVHAAVILNRHHHDGQRVGVLPLVDFPAKADAIVVEDGAAGASAITAVAAGRDDCQRVLIRQKLSDLLPQLQALHVLLEEVAVARLERILGQLLQFGVV